MLIKEYRIPMPLSVEEYRIAQLYMIQKKSREESQGTGSGVEIIENEPYTDGPGGNGQHTQKVYHIGKHIPGWLVSLLPKNALIVEEEAWNAYPYTRTRYTCPFVEKFSIDIETRYFNDAGTSENVFNLSSSELKNRTLDNIDIVKEHSSDDKKEEDPKFYKSKKTGRGPLSDDWLAEIKRNGGNSDGKIMCAYKLCKVEFKYWGMQSKIEKFIHDTGLRKVMSRAHKQAWCWQDEWFGLAIADIRKLERETQLALRLKFGNGDSAMENESEDDDVANDSSSDEFTTEDMSNNTTIMSSSVARRQSVRKKLVRQNSTSTVLSMRSTIDHQEEHHNQAPVTNHTSQDISRISFDVSSDEDEFFDATDELPQRYSLLDDDLPTSTNNPWKSLENISKPDFNEKLSSKQHPQFDEKQHSTDSDIFDQTDTNLPSSSQFNVLFLIIHGGNALEASGHGIQSNKQSDLQTLKTTFENVMKSHYKAAIGRVAMRLVACPVVCNDAFHLLQNLSPFGHDNTIAHEQTLPSALVSLFATSSSLYQDKLNSLALSCNLEFNSFVDSPEGSGFNGQVCIIGDTVGSILGYDMLCGCSDEQGSVCGIRHDKDVSRTWSIPNSHNMKVFAPQQRFQSDSNRVSASTLGTSAISQSIDNSFLSVSASRSLSPSLSPKRRSSPNCYAEAERSLSSPGSSGAPSERFLSRTQSSSSESLFKLDFEVSEFFMLGSPLGLILAMRQLSSGNNTIMPSTNVCDQRTPQKPACRNIYNLFYTADPSSSRIEPLLDMRFSGLPPVTVGKYQMYPLGDGQSIAIGDVLASSLHYLGELHPGETRSSCNGTSKVASCKQETDNVQQKDSLHDVVVASDDVRFDLPAEASLDVNSKVAKRWWGEKRMDYALFYPKVLSDFPSCVLPHLFHSSFWESVDVAAFVLRQVVKHDEVQIRLNDYNDVVRFTPTTPKEKWTKKRNQVKLKNSSPNHRARDSIALENDPQIITGRFMYGPLDVYALKGEKVDIYVMTPPPSSEWVLLASEVTNNSGRVTCTIPDSQKLGLGIHPIKMVVCGDHSTADSYLAVLPPDTDCVIFSIDGSFTASVSIMGSDPKVRPGSVDVVRFWQDLGYLIIYITARPNIMKHRVVTWLSQHNFPKGLVWFGDALTADPLKQKATLLKTLKTEYKLHYAAGYGSSKDIWVYTQLGMRENQIYIVGKTSKKLNSQCSVLSEGYSSHLSELKSRDRVVAAKFNAQIILRKGCFDLPCQSNSLKNKSSLDKKRRSVARSQIS